LINCFIYAFLYLILGGFLFAEDKKEDYIHDADQDEYLTYLKIEYSRRLVALIISIFTIYFDLFLICLMLRFTRLN